MFNNTVPLAIDVGSTFSDSVVLDNKGRVVASKKTLNAHEKLAITALQGVLEALTDADFPI